MSPIKVRGISCHADASKGDAKGRDRGRRTFFPQKILDVYARKKAVYPDDNQRRSLWTGPERQVETRTSVDSHACRTRTGAVQSWVSSGQDWEGWNGRCCCTRRSVSVASQFRPVYKLVGEWKAPLVRENEAGIQGLPSFFYIRQEFVPQGVHELVQWHSTIRLKKFLETNHLIQGEMTQPPAGKVIWV